MNTEIYSPTDLLSRFEQVDEQSAEAAERAAKGFFQVLRDGHGVEAETSESSAVRKNKRFILRADGSIETSSPA
ncbi:hypothetical protein [Marinobacter sp.]|uniref:hypothetical protein n=1 Tax=Marinobacter sp. TaxID=50741 RepID=UPI003A8D1E4D